MARIVARLLALVVALAFVLGGCSVFDSDPTRVTLAELLTGAYDPEQVTGFDVEAMGLELDEPSSFCEAVGTTPLRWTVDALVPMQVLVDSFSAIGDVPEEARPAVGTIVEFTQRRLRWSLTGEGARPVWDARIVAAVEVIQDVAITSCPDLPLVVGRPRQSERPPGWAGMSEAEVMDHCASMAQRMTEGIAEFEADRGRPPRHQMEMDVPVEYYGATDFHGLATDPTGWPHVVPVPGGACDR